MPLINRTETYIINSGNRTTTPNSIANLHTNGAFHDNVLPVSRPPSIILFPLPHSHFKAVISVQDVGNATLTRTGAYTALLGPRTRWIPWQESFAYQAPEFLKMEGPGTPPKETDVYAFGSPLCTVRMITTPLCSQSAAAG